jgi:hypothetical protein
VTRVELTKLWILAERFLMPKLQNVTMSAICASYRGLNSAATKDEDAQNISRLVELKELSKVAYKSVEGTMFLSSGVWRAGSAVFPKMQKVGR